MRVQGRRDYCDVRAGGRLAPDAAWGYDHPSPGYDGLAGYLAFYPAPMDRCLVDDDVVTPQPGGFYGGWITLAVRGPFKGPEGTHGW